MNFVLAGNTLWFIADGLRTEEEAAWTWPNFPHKKLREFQVEVSDAD